MITTILHPLSMKFDKNMIPRSRTFTSHECKKFMRHMDYSSEFGKLCISTSLNQLSNKDTNIHDCNSNTTVDTKFYTAANKNR